MGVEESSLNHDELEEEDDVELVAAFLQDVFDNSEMWSDYEPGARIRAQHELGQAMATLRAHGWRVFGARGKGTLSGPDGSTTPWRTAYLRVVRADSDQIVKVAPVAAAEAPEPTQAPTPAKAPEAPESGLASRAGMAGVSVETQARREIKEALPSPSTQQAVPTLPKRLSGLSGGELGTYGWRMLIARQRLQEEGRSHKAQLNRSGSLVPADESGWRQRVAMWEQKVVDYCDEWGWAPEEEVRQAFDNGGSEVDPSTRPRPAWRARVSGRIDGGLLWIEAHWVTIEQLGLHTE
jgi:hypothetical protein